MLDVLDTIQKTNMKLIYNNLDIVLKYITYLLLFKDHPTSINRELSLLNSLLYTFTQQKYEFCLFLMKIAINSMIMNVVSLFPRLLGSWEEPRSVLLGNI